MSSLFTALMRDFAQSIDLPALEPDEHGCYYMMFDDLIVVIQLEKAIQDRILFQSYVGILPSAYREQFYLRLLNANVLFTGTEGATLAVSAETGLISLQRSETLSSLDFPTLTRILESFVNQTEKWTELCALPGNAGDIPESAKRTDKESTLRLDGDGVLGQMV